VKHKIRRFFVVLIFWTLGVSNLANAQKAEPASREVFQLAEQNQLKLSVQVQRASTSSGDVVYVHGATFGADLSVFHTLDGQSWADALAEKNLNVWGFDFAGYGSSDRYPKTTVGPAGRMTDAVTQIHRVISFIKKNNGDKPVLLVAHSWGASVAIKYAGQFPENIKGLVLFAPVITRTPSPSAQAAPATAAAPAPPSVYPISALTQYRRFVEDVPKGQAQVMSEVHFQRWARAFLESDKTASERSPASVITPFGPVADFMAMWSGQQLYDAKLVKTPTLLVRGAWDSVCNDSDAGNLMAQLSAVDKADVKIERATHLMHLESERVKLYSAVNNFLVRVNQ
jgi:alpha-beta hydrolase superfamily lysophospholipase